MGRGSGSQLCRDEVYIYFYTIEPTMLQAEEEVTKLSLIMYLSRRHSGKLREKNLGHDQKEVDIGGGISLGTLYV